MAAATVTAARVRELFDYNPDTGLFIRKLAGGWAGRYPAGSVAGYVRKTLPYVILGIDGQTYLAHRIAVLYQTGEWPANKVDHIDGDPRNNAWSNLRDVTQQRNSENRRAPTKGKKSGLPIGVSIDRRDGAIRADITVNGKAKSLGRFKTPEDAHAAYVEAKRAMHAGCTI